MGFWVVSLRNEPVLRDQVDQHVPLSSVGERIVKQPLDEATIHRLVSGLDERLEEIVGPFYLVPEEQKGLAELPF